PTSTTSSNDTDAPTSADRSSTRTFSPEATRYCLPPALMTAYIARPWTPEKGRNYNGNHELRVHAGAGRRRHAQGRRGDRPAPGVRRAAGARGGAVHRRLRRQAAAPGGAPARRRRGRIPGKKRRLKR